MRQNPHVRICGGPGSATTLVYPNLRSGMARSALSGAVNRKANAPPTGKVTLRVQVRLDFGLDDRKAS